MNLLGASADNLVKFESAALPWEKHTLCAPGEGRQRARIPRSVLLSKKPFRTKSALHGNTAISDFWKNEKRVRSQPGRRGQGVSLATCGLERVEEENSSGRDRGSYIKRRDARQLYRAAREDRWVPSLARSPYTKAVDVSCRQAFLGRINTYLRGTCA